MIAPERVSARLVDVVSTLDMIAGWLADPSCGDLQACAEVSLAAEELHTLRLEIEREQFAHVVAA